MIKKILTTPLITLLLLATTDIYAYGEWSAKVIDVHNSKQVKYIEDYALLNTGDQWDFSEGDMEGAKISGTRTHKLSKNKLKIETTENTYLQWGDFELNDPEQGKLTIAKQWSQQAWPWVVQIKLKQTKPASKWYVDAAYHVHGKSRKKRSTAVYKGTKEKILQFDMGLANRTYNALRIGTSTPGNTVSIDWVRIVRPSLGKTFLYKFTVPGKPLAAKFAYSSNGKTIISLNGTPVKESGGMPPYTRTLGIYNDQHNIIQGENWLCVFIEGVGAYQGKPKYGDQFFFMEGAIIDDKGNNTRIKTDDAWLAGNGELNCNAHKQFSNNAKITGNIKKKWPVMGNTNNKDRIGERPYLGPIELKYSSGEYPIFKTNEDIAINVNIIGEKPDQTDIKIFTAVQKIDDINFNSHNKLAPYTEANQGLVNLGRPGAGNYELIIKYYRHGIIKDERRQEIVIVGPQITKVKNDNATSTAATEKQIDSIHFNQKNIRKVLCGTKDGDSKFVDSKNDGFFSTLAKYPEAYYTNDKLVLPPERASWCSVQFTVNELYKPHRVRVEFPEDGSRNMIFVVAEGSRFERVYNIGKGGAVVRLSTGVYTSEKNINKTSFADFFYWPNNKNATFTIVNAGRSWLDRGAITSVSISKLDHLPSLESYTNKNTNSYIGPFVERVDRTTPRLFYGGPLEARFTRELYNVEFPGYYQAWYNTINNLIEYMKYSGQNTYYAGIYMYYGGWFPSPDFEGYTSGWTNLPPGWRDGAFALMAKMFEVNNMNIVIGVQFIGDRKLNQLDTVSNAEVIEGKNSVRFITSSGEQVRGFQNQGFNFLLPEVKGEILSLAETIAKHYSGYPSVKGVTWMRQPEFARDAGGKLGQKSAIQTGYGDTTVSKYIKETDSKLPEQGKNKDRFNKRYQWLMTNEKEQWVSWRCQKVHDMDKAMYNILSKQRPDWTLWRLILKPAPEEIKKWKNNHLSFQDVYKQGGSCSDLYKNDKNIKTMQVLATGADMKYKRRSRQIASLSDDVKAFYKLAATKASLNGDDIQAHIGFGLEHVIKNKTQWPWNKMLVVGYSVPSSNEFKTILGNPDFASNGRAISIGWSDVGHFMGAEKDIQSYVIQEIAK